MPVSCPIPPVKPGAILGLMDYAALSAPFQLAAAEQDGPKALELLARMLHSLALPWDTGRLYPHIPPKEGGTGQLTHPDPGHFG